MLYRSVINIVIFTMLGVVFVINGYSAAAFVEGVALGVKKKDTKSLQTDSGDKYDV